MLIKKFLGQQFNHLGISDFRADAGIRNPIRFGQRFGDLVFTAEAQLDEHFTKEFLMIGTLLLFQGAFQMLLLHDAP